MTERKTATAKKAKTAKAPKVPVDMQKKLLHYMKLTREIEYRIERVLYATRDLRSLLEPTD